MEERLFLKKNETTELSEYDFSSLKKALQLSPQEIIDKIKKSGLKGRGGAGFPTGLKWELAFKQKSTKKYLICNGDEGEPGTFKDRYLFEKNPYKVLEGMIITAYVIGADEGYCYIRGEYTGPIKIMNRVIKEAGENNLLGNNILNSDFNFKLWLVKGAGAYVCGDETSLINSIEGKRGCSRIKPPYPIKKGLFGKPTVVNNVETLACVAEIIKNGVDAYLDLGTEKSRGTKLICLSGDIHKPGVYEIEFGQCSLREIIDNFGGGIRNNKQLKFLVPGGISTSILGKDGIDISYTYEELARVGSSLGSGAIIIVAEGCDLFDIMLNVSRFFMDETCGTCFPCREGNRQVFHFLKDNKGGFTERQRGIISDIGNTINLAARCGLGQSSLNFINSVINKFAKEVMLRGEAIW